MEESKKTYHEQEKKKMTMKIGKAGGATGAVVLLGVATLAAAAAIVSALVVRRKGRKSGKNHHSHQEVEQSLQTEFPETSNKENDQDNASAEREFILPNTSLSVKNHQCNDTADMDVVKDDSASFLFTENLKLDEKPTLEINGGTGGPAYKKKEACCSDNTKKLESAVNTEGTKKEFHLPTFDDKLLLEPESKDQKQDPEVEIELTMDDDAIGGVLCNKIIAESNQEVQENIEWEKNAVEMQFSEEDETKNCLDQEIIISTCGFMPGNIVTENYGEGGQDLVMPVFNSRLINDHENTSSNKKESSLLIATVQKIEVNGAIETAQVDDSIHKSKMHSVKRESDYSDAVIVQDYEQEISCNDNEQNVENNQFEEYVKDVQTLSIPTELPETLKEENDQDNAGKVIQFILPHPCTGTADMDVGADSASCVFANNLKLNENPIVDGSVTVIKEEFHLPTFDDKLPLEPELKDEMQNREEEIELTKDDDTIEGVPIDKIMAENNQEMQENIEAKKNAVEMQFSEEEYKTKNFRDQDKIIAKCSSMPGNTATENSGEGGRELLLPLFDSQPIIDHENTNVYKKTSLPTETVEKIEGNGTIETAQVDDSIHKASMQLVKQGCDRPDAEIVRDYEQISCHDDEQNAENSQYEDHVKDVLTFSLPKELPANDNGQDNASKEIQFILPRTHPLEKKSPCTGAADVDKIKTVSASFSFTEYLILNEKPIADGDVTVIKEEFQLPTFDDKLLLEPESKNKMDKHEVEIELAKEDGSRIDKIMAEDDKNMQENIDGKLNAVEMQFSEEKTKNRHDQEIVSTVSSMPGTTVLENYGEGGKELLSVFDSRPIIEHENVNSDDKEGSLPIETVQKSERNEAIEISQIDDGIHNAEVQLVEQEECDYPDAEIQVCEQKISHNDDEQNTENGHCGDYAKDVQTFSFPILSYPSNIMAEIAIEKDSMNEQLSTEAIGVVVTNVGTSANQEMKENSTLELVVCQQKEFKNAEEEIEEAPETICAGIDTLEYDPIMQMSKNEEKGENNDNDNDNDRDESDEDDLTNTIEESSVGTGNSPPESNTECAEESLSELSIDGKGNSKMTYTVELAEAHNNQPTYSSRRRILIGALSALSWFSCTWFFGLSFVKLGLIVFLTMILSKIHGY
ncbi:uncharacterized protein LOC111394197 [Olea europaea var. sylvestris]|uniref:uncharacterized protein LOC111394197 n=1 Tax=Olea europaea var. sylvestris TaxID=158386 RepID=UPI000C1D3AB0|nr:uncharacterized protein LOC111394197 [Olea europaea var. sylvestris]